MTRRADMPLVPADFPRYRAFVTDKSLLDPAAKLIRDVKISVEEAFEIVSHAVMDDDQRIQVLSRLADARVRLEEAGAR